MFEFRFDKRIIYIVLGIILLSSIRSFLNLNVILALPAIIIAITFHEYAHAYVANKLGDYTPKMQGRLTLNPLSHIDIFGFVLLLFVGIGWGKPVEINSNNFKRTISKSKGEILVSVAGPIMNIVLAIIFSFIFVITVNMLEKYQLYNYIISKIIIILLQEIIIINIGLGVFNLLPIQPLDGSKIFLNIVPFKIKNWLLRNSNVIYVIFLLLWITGILGSIVSPIIKLIYDGLIKFIIMVLCV